MAIRQRVCRKPYKRVGINKMKNQMKKLMMISLIVLGVGLFPNLYGQADCDQSCLDWWLVILDDYGNIIEEHYLYTTCNGKETISSCDESAGQAYVYLHEEDASCEENWGLGVVMSHEDN